MGVIIYAFPATGKTYYCNKNNNSIELSSEKYHWLDFKSGENNKGKMKQINNKWPQNYYIAIKEMIEKYEYVFVTHSGSLICQKYNIPYILIYPSLDMKEIILKRMNKRNNSKEIIDNMNNNYEKYISDCENDKYANKKIVLKDNQYITNVIMNCK